MNAISFIASDGEDVLWHRLSKMLERASILRIASAFLGAGDEIASWVEGSTERSVQILVRMQYPTNPDSVAALRSHPRVRIHASDPAETFHEKLFLALGPASKPQGAYVGSANWTQGGLRRNQEAGVWVAEPVVLGQIRDHLDLRFKAAPEVSDAMLAELRSDFDWQTSHGKRPRKDRGTLVSSWSELKAANDGRFLIKQNGISFAPFIEGEDDFSEFARNHSSQTFGQIPSTFKKGLGMIVSWIARRRNGSPDRLIYGRGRIAGFDRKRWILPEKYLTGLGKRGLDSEKIRYLKRWPDILWLDPAEFINYPSGCDQFLWLSDYMEPSFQKGFRWIPPDVWKACNLALNEHTDRFGVLPLDRQGIWWNRHTKIDDVADPLYMTKARIEELNLED